MDNVFHLMYIVRVILCLFSALSRGVVSLNERVSSSRHTCGYWMKTGQQKTSTHSQTGYWVKAGQQTRSTHRLDRILDESRPAKDEHS